MSAMCIFMKLGRASLITFFAAIAGCGGKGNYPVHGEVSFKDGSDVAAVAGGQVIFEPADANQPQISARGYIQPDGTFQMGTSHEGDGVPPGTYRVMVTQPPFFRKKRDQERPKLFAESFQKAATSGLDITVTGPVSDYKITLQK